LTKESARVKNGQLSCEFTIEGISVAHRVTEWVIVLALVLSVAACAASDIPIFGDAKERNMTVADVPGREDVVRGDADPPVVTLNLKSGLHERRLSASEDLPGSVILPTTNLNAVPVTAALQAVLSGTDISLSWNTGALGSRLVTVMNLRGPLPKVVEKICSAARVFCTFRHGSIELSEKETFVVSIPPVVRSISSASAGGTSAASAAGSTTSSPSSSTSNSIVEAINKLLDGEKATVDDQGGNIVYTATVDVEERVSRYLSELRTERPLIVLQMYIWEVTLNNENAQGINWSSFNAKIAKGNTMSLASEITSAAAAKGSVSLGAVTSGIISANAIASFIATKGRVQTISNPQLTFVSGSTASLKIGGTQRYISQVGTNISSNVSGNAGSGAANNTSTNTVSTDSIDTGLAINVAGSYENGVVFANLDLSIKSLVDIGSTSSGGGTIDLPITTDEKMNTVLRVRPGDSLVLAGYVTSSDNATTQGLPTGATSALPLYGDDAHANRELVMIVKPSIVLFSDKEGEPAKAATALPEPIVVDGGGSRAFQQQHKTPTVLPTHVKKEEDPVPDSTEKSREAVEASRFITPARPQPAVGVLSMPQETPPTPDVSVSDLPSVIIGGEPTAQPTPAPRRTAPPQPRPSTETFLVAPSSDDPSMASFSHAFDNLLQSLHGPATGVGTQ
jgi:Flp pilus assembly secretin CpaC